MLNENNQGCEQQPENTQPLGPHAARKRAESLTDEEMNMAALAHASVLLGFLSGGLAGVPVALVIWLAYKDKSRYVAFHAMQSLVFQLGLVAVAMVVLLAIVLSAVTICLIPLALVLVVGIIALPFAHLLYGLYAAYETYYGADFRYWKVGDVVQQQMEASH